MSESFVDILVGSRVDVYMAAELLENNSIPSLIKPRLGAGFVVRGGDMMESYTLQVRASDAVAANELCTAFLVARGQMEQGVGEETEEPEEEDDMDELEMLSDMEEEEGF